MLLQDLTCDVGTILKSGIFWVTDIYVKNILLSYLIPYGIIIWIYEFKLNVSYSRLQKQ